MARKRSPNTNTSLHPGGTEEADAVQAQQALLDRPSISIRARVVGAFVLLFLLMVGITVAAVVLISGFRARLQFLEVIGNYFSEIQQARRFEKNFFLYRTNLTDALTNIETAQHHLDQSAEDLKSVVGAEKYTSMKERLTLYQGVLEELLTTNDRKPAQNAEYRQIEGRLRKYGAQILTDAQTMIDRERIAIHSMLSTSMVAAMGFLVLMFFSMAYLTGFIVRAVLRPLRRFVAYTDRIGSGDYSPILPTRKYRDEFSNLAIALNQMMIELKVRQEQLLQSAKMAAVGSLTSGIAHELNNPLNNIGITTESLIDGFEDYPDEEKLRMLEQIYTQVERASGTVRNLLDFTRKEHPTFTRVSVGQIVESTAKLVRNELGLGEIGLRLDLDDGLPEIRGNPRQLEQVFLNLFLNSIQAMPDGGTLSVRAEVDDESVRVDVTDTGVGIPEEHLDMLFDPFFTTKETGQGTGLGLSVSYSIIEKHQGRITVESEVGKGTTFSVFLPVVENE